MEKGGQSSMVKNAQIYTIKGYKEQKIKLKDNMAYFKIDQEPCHQGNSFKYQPSPPKTKKNFEKISNLSFYIHTETLWRDRVNITNPSRINYSSYLKRKKFKHLFSTG